MNLTKHSEKLFGGGQGTLELAGGRRYPGSRYPDHLTAAGQETSEHDAAFRWREGADSNLTAVCDPELKTVTILSSG